MFRPLLPPVGSAVEGAGGRGCIAFLSPACEIYPSATAFLALALLVPSLHRFGVNSCILDLNCRETPQQKGEKFSIDAIFYMRKESIHMVGRCVR